MCVDLSSQIHYVGRASSIVEKLNEKNLKFDVNKIHNCDDNEIVCTMSLLLCMMLLHYRTIIAVQISKGGGGGGGGGGGADSTQKFKTYISLFFALFFVCMYFTQP